MFRKFLFLLKRASDTAFGFGFFVVFVWILVSFIGVAIARIFTNDVGTLLITGGSVAVGVPSLLAILRFVYVIYDWCCLELAGYKPPEPKVRSTPPPASETPIRPFGFSLTPEIQPWTLWRCFVCGREHKRYMTIVLDRFVCACGNTEARDREREQVE